jgi:DNA-directed RNA polymerase sigma subunit (sigma70/sigma32)
MPPDGIEDYARRAAGAPRMTSTEAVAALALARGGEPVARTKLFDAHRRYVAIVAKRYARSDLSSDEQIRLGEQGLEQAIDRFDLSKGFTFSTYASWHIRQAILGGIGHEGGTAGVREPRAPRPIPGVDAVSLQPPRA